MGLFPRRCRQVVGIDFSETSLKAVLLSHTRKSTVLEDYFYEKISKPEHLPSAIENLKKKLIHPKKTNVVVALHGSQVVVRVITMPKMEKEEFLQSLKFEEEVYIPFPPEERVIDHAILGEQNGQYVVLLVGGRKKVIEELVSPFISNGLQPDVGYLSGLSLINAFKYNNPHQNAPIILLDIGEKYSLFTFLDRGIPLIIREIPIGGRMFSEQLEDVLHIKFEEAELLKCNPKGKEAVVKTAIEPICYRLAEEINVSIEYISKMSSAHPTSIYFSGGGARCVGVPDYFEKAFNVDTVFWDPLEKIVVLKHLQKDSVLNALKDLFVVSLGSALL